MATVHIDPPFDDEERRRRLFAGELIVFTSVPEVAAFATFTQGLIIGVFSPDEPTKIHDAYSPEEIAEILIDFKSRFIHHPESIGHVRSIVRALGCSTTDVYADVPKLRTAFPAGGLNTGIANAFQAHRDTWYGAPGQQINWWMPVWPAAAENIMEFFPRYFGAEIANNSDQYSYYEANAWRSQIKNFSGSEGMSVPPAPLTPLPDDEARLCLVPPVGGIMLFSGDHLHASIPNLTDSTRYSIDFRTVTITDVRSGRGAPRVDVRCAGTALRDFRRLTDLAPMSEEDMRPHDAPDAEGIKVYVPS
jgi:hypothetical protein